MSNEKKKTPLEKIQDALVLLAEAHAELSADEQQAKTSSDEGGTNPGNPPPPPPPPPGGN